MEYLELMPAQPQGSSWFPIVFAIAALIVVAGIVYVIVATIRNRRALRRAGHDPDTVQAQLTTGVLDSELLAPSPAATREDRLAELDRLHARGVITAQERDLARAKILTE